MNEHQPSTRTLAKQYGLFHGDITAFSLKHHCTNVEAVEYALAEKQAREDVQRQLTILVQTWKRQHTIR